ncbi:MAG: hypothetical protein IT317_13050 [Anaerolineales bacterium]|nr:hypothetical protein [Anaerolineales bacterium]
MKRLDMRLIAGVLLIAGGIFYLLTNLGIIRWGGLVWAGAFAIAALGFFAAVVNNRQQWWFIIPGMTLLALAALISLDYFAPALSEQLGGPLFLGGVGLSFLAIYVMDRKLWWAIIPAGALLTLAAVAGLENSESINGGGILFLGLGLTFGLLALAPMDGGKPLRWAFIPAGALLSMGALLLVGFERALGYIWPAALIVGGGLLLWRAWRRGPG